MRRGILGGTFDPPHIAHLVAGEAAYRQFELDRVTFMPAGSPWQKGGREVSAADHRWNMTELAVQGIEYFEADRRELEREGPTYTIDSLTSLPPDETPVLILGSDAAAGLSTWHRWEELLSLAEIAVAARPGTSRSEVEEAMGTGARWLDMPELAVSGTMLRERVRSGKSIRFLVPDPVWQYIAVAELYVEGT